VRFLKSWRNFLWSMEKPDFSTLGDPVDVAKQWAAEIKPGYEQYLQKLLKYLGANGEK
jgi:hypothetical protein